MISTKGQKKLSKSSSKMELMNRWICGLLTAVILWSGGCGDATAPPLFTRLSTEECGILFNNEITPNDSLNILDYEYIYNGGGVAVADFNNDGWQDLFFTGNMVSNAMYLNKGQDGIMSFQDISEKSGVQASNSWCSGVATVDINSDGRMDLYIATNTYKKGNQRKNLLYINQGVDDEGVPIFQEQASHYGLADSTYAMNSAFFDYDNDGDLDVFIIVNEMEGSRYPSAYARKRGVKRFRKDKLYRNDWSEELGHPVFTDVSEEAGINEEGYSLGLNIVDINNDGWQDVYVTNDFISDDLMYVNNGDGTFTDKAKEYFKHTSHSAMGNDVVDINNDGLEDIIALDMLPEDNYRRKTMMGAMTYTTYLNTERFGYSYQFVRNTLQLNQGSDPVSGEPLFSDVSLAAGIAATDWSWTPLVADFDNDMDQDIIITNGFPKDVTDRDFIDYQANNFRYAPKEMLIQQIPEVKLHNYAFRNEEGMRFKDVSANWGITEKTFSNGAVYADLDNDGDLDYVINNINDPAFIYENNAPVGNHFLRVRLEGVAPNVNALGASVTIYSGGEKQTKVYHPHRGYLSSMEPFLHFGLGAILSVDSISVKWPDHSYSTLYNSGIDTVLTVVQGESGSSGSVVHTTNEDRFFTEIDSSRAVQYHREEADFIDFNVQRLLPHKLSQYGPGIAVGDVNGDGLADVYVSGSHRYSGELFVHQADGTFSVTSLNVTEEGMRPEEMGALFFDADGDGDDDLYVVHGSYEFEINDNYYQDRLYINDGGVLKYEAAALPEFLQSGSCVRASDFDHDGDLDLFVGGRVHPHEYPKPVSSILLENTSVKAKISFRIANAESASVLDDVGMISDALWTDVDNDGWVDLMLAGEYMPITILQNQKGTLKKMNATGLEGKNGWWNGISSGDYDHDGDIDYVVGNVGVNTLFNIAPDRPVKAYGKDFDNNGGYDLVLTSHLKQSTEAEGSKEFTFHGRGSLISQMNYVRDRFKMHKDFAVAEYSKVVDEEMAKGVLELELNYPYTSLVTNLGNGKFEITPMHSSAQIAPIYGMQTIDVNADGYQDLVMVGNDYGMELTMGKCDALHGVTLLNDGKLGFTPITNDESGFVVSGDGKSLAQFYVDESCHLLAGQNKENTRQFKLKEKGIVVKFGNNDSHALIRDENQNLYRIESYFGNGFLSQSERSFVLPQNHTLEKVVATN